MLIIIICVFLPFLAESMRYIIIENFVAFFFSNNFNKDRFFYVFRL